MAEKLDVEFLNPSLGL